jgi:sortase (surface protein transpeptidase)
MDTFSSDNVDRQQNDQNRNRNPRNNQNRRNQKPREFQHPTLENMIIPKASVQDRLLKIAKNSETPTGDGIVNTGK